MMMMMIEIDNIDDFPKLIPDGNIRFDAKDEIRRAPETNFECSESEYKQMIEEEELANKYHIRLTPDTRTVMPDKNSLKHNTAKSRLLRLSFVAAAAAAAFALVLIITKDKPDIPPVASVAPEPKPDTAIITKPNPEPTPAIVENKVHVPAKKTVAKTKKPVLATTVPESTSPDMAIETSADKDIIPSPENVRIEKLERIASVPVAVEMMEREKTVFVYQQDYRQSFASGSIISVAAIVRKLSTDVADTKDRIFDSFKVTDILDHLSLDRGIDREIDEWAENNPDIPFNVFTDYSSENEMKEIYDENGTLIRVIFFTSKSLKYKSNKTYYASNNNKE